jgi:hypothetical protein
MVVRFYNQSRKRKGIRSDSSFFFARKRPNMPLCFSFFLSLLVGAAVVGALANGVWYILSAGLMLGLLCLFQRFEFDEMLS